MPKDLNLYLIRHGQALHNVCEEYFSEYANTGLAEALSKVGLQPCSSKPIKPERLEIMKKFSEHVVEIILSGLADVDYSTYVDPVLTDLGHAQATAVGASLAGVEFATIGVSPLNRALESLADMNLCSARVYAHHGFREVSGGNRLPDKCLWPGYAELKQKSNANVNFDRCDLRAEDILWPVGREKKTEVVERFQKAVEELVVDCKNGHNVAIVTHKGAITRLCELNGVTLAKPPGNCEVIVLKATVNDDGKLVQLKYNSTLKADFNAGQFKSVVHIPFENACFSSIKTSISDQIAATVLELKKLNLDYSAVPQLSVLTMYYQSLFLKKPVSNNLSAPRLRKRSFSF